MISLLLLLQLIGSTPSIILLPANEDCQIVISRTGKVTITNCKDVDEAARTFWNAVETHAPCKEAR